MHDCGVEWSGVERWGILYRLIPFFLFFVSPSIG